MEDVAGHTADSAWKARGTSAGTRHDQIGAHGLCHLDDLMRGMAGLDLSGRRSASSPPGRRRQSNGEHKGVGIAEAGQGSTPVGLGRNASDPPGRDLFATRDQSWAETAVDDLGRQLVEG